MCASSNSLRFYLLLVACSTAVIPFSGCSRSKYRLQADREAYGTIEERNGDPRWSSSDVSIELDPRSRYYDVYDPDKTPMPPDDPFSHEYMYCVAGMKGWKHWHDNGDRTDLENSAWREALSQYVEITEDGAVKLDIDSSLRLTYVHSPNHQRQLETLYLSALDVSAERFRLDTQYFGGYDLRYAHNGSLIPAGLGFSPLLNRFVVTPPFEGPGVENNRLTVGRPFGANPALQASRRFATAGELLVGFANSFVFEFTGGDANLASSLANFSLVQPLLRGAGRDIALEELTFDERNLLANLRAYSQFRQGLYTQVAIGELGVTGPQRGISSTELQSFSGQGGVGGFLGLLQQLQQIRNGEDNLSLQLRTRDRLVALYNSELIDLVQVDQFRQSIENQRATLLDQTNAMQLALDNYKTGVLGLPPSLEIDLDQDMIRQFQLFPRESNPLLESLFELQSRVGDVAELFNLAIMTNELQGQVEALPGNQNVDDIDRTLNDLLILIESVQRRLEQLPADLQQMEVPSEPPKPELTQREIALIQVVQERLSGGAESFEEYFESIRDKLQKLSDTLTEDNSESLVKENVAALRELLMLTEGTLLIQFRARNIHQEPEQVLKDAIRFIEPVQELFDSAREDLARMDAVVPLRESAMTETKKDEFRKERRKLHQRISDLESDPELGFEVTIQTLQRLRQGYSEETRVETVRGLIAWIQAFLQIVERLSLVPAQARLEIITLDDVELEPEEAFQIGLANRLDFMNGRAALVDQWRDIQVKADALQGILNITASGDIRTARNNPVSFRAPTSTVRLGLEFDAPLTRLLERNDYRESLIRYQQSRRQFIQSRDSLEKGIRALLRTLEQRRQQLEIQRRAVAIALRQVDETQLRLSTPPGQLQPGARPSISPTTAINLLSAQRSLQATQNSLLAAWLNYHAARMRLYRELGIMSLDAEGRWIEDAIIGSENGMMLTPGEMEQLPPLPLPEPSAPPLPDELPPLELPELPEVSGFSTPPPVPQSWIENTSHFEALDQMKNGTQSTGRKRAETGPSADDVTDSHSTDQISDPEQSHQAPETHVHTPFVGEEGPAKKDGKLSTIAEIPGYFYDWLRSKRKIKISTYDF